MTRFAFESMLEEIFGMSPGTLRGTDSRETIQAWTSVADVQIATLVASELGLDADAELLEAESVDDLIRALENRGAFRN